MKRLILFISMFILLSSFVSAEIINVDIGTGSSGNNPIQANQYIAFNYSLSESVIYKGIKVCISGTSGGTPDALTLTLKENNETDNLPSSNNLTSGSLAHANVNQTCTHYNNNNLTSVNLDVEYVASPNEIVWFVLSANGSGGYSNLYTAINQNPTSVLKESANSGTTWTLLGGDNDFSGQLQYQTRTNYTLKRFECDLDNTGKALGLLGFAFIFMLLWLFLLYTQIPILNVIVGVLIAYFAWNVAACFFLANVLFIVMGIFSILAGIIFAVEKKDLK